MLTKSIIALSLVLGSASLAFAYDEPEGRMSDRYAFLDPASVVSARAAGMRAMASDRVMLNQYGGLSEPEHRLSDLYPPLGASTNVRIRASMIFTASFGGLRADEPEYRLSDRYAWIEPTYGSRGTGRIATAHRMKHGSKRT